MRITPKLSEFNQENFRATKIINQKYINQDLPRD